MAYNCGECLILEEKYNCGWCSSTNSCKNIDDRQENDSCLERNKTCPNVQIMDFYPKVGPLEGGIKVTIRGINLGKEIQDIESIKVAGIPCHALRENFIRTKEVTCLLDNPNIDETKEGPVIVKVSTHKQT